MFHVAAFTASLTTPTDGAVAALQDDVLNVQNSRFLLGQDMMLLFAASFFVGQTRCRLNSPAIRAMSPTYIRPINTVAVPATDPNVADYRRNPFRLRRLEELAAEITGTDVAAQRATVLIGLETRPESPQVGDIFTFRGTSVTAATANAWTSITTTWAETLPHGTYAVVGMQVQSTNAIAARLIFDGQVERPGSVSVTALGNRTHDMFAKGGLGVWGRFSSYNLPIVQVLCNAADASHEIYLDLIRTAAA